MSENNNPAPERARGNGRVGRYHLDNLTISASAPGINNRFFDGPTFNQDLDGPRLRRQLDAVRAAMASGEWLTLRQISLMAKCSEASASARLRDLRKQRFGGHLVERKRVGGGLFAYRLIIDGEEVTA
jgi:hypothetical protein